MLTKKGLCKTSDSASMRRQKTVKLLVRSWSIKNLDMTDKDWENVLIENIQLTDNSEIIFSKFLL